VSLIDLKAYFGSLRRRLAANGSVDSGVRVGGRVVPLGRAARQATDELSLQRVKVQAFEAVMAVMTDVLEPVAKGRLFEPHELGSEVASRLSAVGWHSVEKNRMRPKQAEAVAASRSFGWSLGFGDAFETLPPDADKATKLRDTIKIEIDQIASNDENQWASNFFSHDECGQSIIEIVTVGTLNDSWSNFCMSIFFEKIPIEAFERAVTAAPLSYMFRKDYRSLEMDESLRVRGCSRTGGRDGSNARFFSIQTEPNLIEAMADNGFTLYPAQVFATFHQRML
jgi:hypothetical protein